MPLSAENSTLSTSNSFRSSFSDGSRVFTSRVNGEPLHRQAERLSELFPLLRELLQTTNVGAELTYRYLGTKESYTIDIRAATGARENDFFQLDPLLIKIDADDPQKNQGLAIDIKYWDSNGNTYHASSELHFTFE